MQVSVIIPVFNAGSFVERAVLSALKLAETAEVIIVEDGSADDSLQKCKKLSESHSNVVLLRHPNGANCGPAASRNLGVRAAKCPFIAFLDADDHFLENRFSGAARIFSLRPDADGVYGTAVYEFHSGVPGNIAPAGISGWVAPEQLLEVLLEGKRGWFSIDTLVVKRTLLERTELFDEHLRQAEDTDLIFRMILKGKLYPDEMNEPVAVITMHGANTTLNFGEAAGQRLEFFKKWFSMMKKRPFSPRINRLIVRYWMDSVLAVKFPWLPAWMKRPVKISWGILWILFNPGIINLLAE